MRPLTGRAIRSKLSSLHSEMSCMNRVSIGVSMQQGQGCAWHARDRPHLVCNDLHMPRAHHLCGVLHRRDCHFCARPTQHIDTNDCLHFLAASANWNQDPFRRHCGDAASGSSAQGCATSRQRRRPCCELAENCLHLIIRVLRCSKLLGFDETLGRSIAQQQVISTPIQRDR